MKKKPALFVIAGIAIVITVYFGIRNSILHEVLNNKCRKLEKKLDLQIKYKHAQFIGLKTFYISNLSVVVNARDTFIKSDSIILNPKLFSLLTGHFRLHAIGLYKSKINATKYVLLKLHNIMNGNKSDLHNIPKIINFAGIINSLQKSILKLVPSDIIIRNSWFSYSKDSVCSILYCENFSYQNSKYIGDVFLLNKSEKKRCLVNGIFDLNQGITLSITHPDASIINIPYTRQWWNSRFGFNSLQFSLLLQKVDNNNQILSGTAYIKDLAIQNERISPDVVYIKSVAINFKVKAGNGVIEMDSTSSVNINKFSFSPYIRYEKSDKHTFSFAFIRKEFEAPDLFNSFPEGLFTTFKGLIAKGRLAYSLKTFIDFDHPDSVQFDSYLENKGFGIEKFGITDFRILNHEYNQDVYDKDRYIKTILVGSDNNDFVPLGDISPYLKYSVLTSEDGDFFYHHGFNLRAFRESIIANIKAKRFARGGSTITMQLVKNAFLSNNKTISRKIEEALIVWMIENLHLVSKERMFEVYLNIIEWGPGVYGIKPASMFYFNKLPDKLTLSESIYLSSIIPRPKGFKYTFISNGEMAGFYNEYSKLLCKVMLKRNQITSNDSSNLQPFVNLTGIAKEYLALPDTLAIEDSLFYKEPEIIEY